MRSIELQDRNIKIETVPEVVPLMNMVWGQESSEYLALVTTTQEKILLLPGERTVLQDLFLWMKTQPGTKAVYHYCDAGLYAEYCASEQCLVTYHWEKQWITIRDLTKHIPTYYDFAWAGPCQPGAWVCAEGISNIACFSWVSTKGEENDPRRGMGNQLC